MTRSLPLFHSARPFPRRFSWTFLLCAFCLFLSGIAASARTQSGLETQYLQQQETALQTSIDYLEDTLQKVKSGRYLITPVGLVEKDALAGLIAARMLYEKKSATEWVQAIKDCGCAGNMSGLIAQGKCPHTVWYGNHNLERSTTAPGAHS